MADSTPTTPGVPHPTPSPGPRPGATVPPRHHRTRRHHDDDLLGVLRIRDFRRLWIALGVSSLGDWLGLLATTDFASTLAHGLSGKGFAITGVYIVRFLPTLVFGALAGVFADRFDRRTVMIVADCLRFAVYLTIPIVGRLDYLYVASFCVESLSLFWMPAKEASVPNLVQPRQLEAANRISLLSTYGSAPIAALVYALLAGLGRALGAGVHYFSANPVDLALYFNACTYLISAATIASLRTLKGRGAALRRDTADGTKGPGFAASLVEGWRFVGGNPLTRGLVIGMLGGFTAGGCVVALGRLFVSALAGGSAAYGLLFGGVFVGLAGGMALGPRLLRGFSRRRLFGLAVTTAGTALAVLAILPNLALATIAVLVVGASAGIAWVTGYTLIGLEVADEVRGRTFSFIYALVQLDLLATLAAAPTAASLIGPHAIRLPNDASIRLDGVTLTLFAAGLVAAAVGVVSYRTMDDRRGVPLRRDLWAAFRRGRHGAPPYPGVFVVLEGGEGSGKSSQLTALAAWLREQGHGVVTTREPGGTPVGASLRSLLLDPATGALDPHTEALLYAADRAEHVARVVRPALERGDWVLSDRFVDSSLAYQAAGRELALDDVRRLNAWGTRSLVPDLTVLLDLPPEVGLARAARRGEADRLEGETLAFHERVRAGFRGLAMAEPSRYAIVDATGSREEVQRAVQEAVAERLVPAAAAPGPAVAGGAA
ncbi:MAG: Thymidylate kinase [Mycobacterium sp.]|nr:Thymidylate kinase [Mycobacterium sp.]MCW2746316.1 Thymidylate kinase [Mycobacterium sp.]